MGTNRIPRGFQGSGYLIIRFFFCRLCGLIDRVLSSATVGPNLEAPGT